MGERERKSGISSWQFGQDHCSFPSSNPSHCTKYVNGEKRFLILALPKRKNSIEKQRAVLTSRSFIKQRESTVSRKVESVLSGKHKQPHSGVGLGVSCVIWLTSWLTALGYWTLLLMYRWLPICSEVRTTRGGRWGTKTAMLIHYKYGIMILGFPWVSFQLLVCQCPHVLVVLSWLVLTWQES